MYGLFCQGFHIVCGSRYMKNGRQIGGPRFKKFLSTFAGKSLFYLTGLPTSDVTNSFKLYSKECIKSINFESSGGFEIGMEIVVKAFSMNYAITEVPSIWNDRYVGTSNFKLSISISRNSSWDTAKTIASNFREGDLLVKLISKFSLMLFVLK